MRFLILIIFIGIVNCFMFNGHKNSQLRVNYSKNRRNNSSYDNECNILYKYFHRKFNIHYDENVVIKVYSIITKYTISNIFTSHHINIINILALIDYMNYNGYDVILIDINKLDVKYIKAICLLHDIVRIDEPIIFDENNRFIGSHYEMYEKIHLL